jgi:peptidoglycan/LPS O-acetylase OafA/YrhL
MDQLANTVGLGLDDRRERLRELDGWRAVSVMLVLLHHVGWYQHPRLLRYLPGLGRVAQYGGPLGVKIFFVISGFVICRLLISEDLSRGSVSLKAFYYRRIFRILPPLAIYLGAVYLLLGLGLVHEQRRAIRDAALFLYDFNFLPQTWLVGHTWSLAVEEQFYLIFPAMWVLTPRRWNSLVFLGVFIVCAASNLSMIYTGWDVLIQNEVRAGFTCISCGVLMAIHEPVVRRVARGVPAFAVALVALTLLLHPVGSKDWQAAVYEGLLVPPAIGLVLLFSLGCGPWLRAFLDNKPVQAVGLTSYGIYLWQQLFTAPRQYFIGSGEMIPMLAPLLCLIVPLSYFLIEKPAMRYGRFLSRRTRIPIREGVA